jgi:phosphoenolpyruvate-protein phosphotransferase
MPYDDQRAGERVLRGRGVSPGIGQGRAVLYPAAMPEFVYSAAVESDPKVELRRLESAIESARRDLEWVRLRVQADIGSDNAEIFAVHEALLTDPELLWRVRERLTRDRVVAEQAVQSEVADAAKRLVSTDDPYFRDRSADIRDVGRRLLANLSPRRSDSIAPLPSASVLVAVEILPSDTVDLDRAHVAAIVTEVGGDTSHVAILARTLGIPAVSAVQHAAQSIAAGEWLIVDGDDGTVTVAPSESQRRGYAVREERRIARAKTEAASAPTPCATRDGERITLCANIGRAEEAHDVRRQRLDGVGLFRTEFLFLDSPESPSFERQLRVYQEVASALDGLPLTIRTLDLGGDKVPLFLEPHTERNPSLGLRGLRFSLLEPQLFESQLRAIAHASSPGPVRILFPMVLGDADLREAKARLLATSERAPGCPRIEVGAMIETPAAVFLIDQILEEVDFVSIGTNDLTQFVLAADRDAVDMLDSYSVLHPSVLRAVARVVTAARAYDRRVTVCGEAAGDPTTALLLIGLGVRELSMSPMRAASVRSAIACVARAEAEDLARQALTCRTSREAAERLAAFAREMLDEAEDA